MSWNPFEAVASAGYNLSKWGLDAVTGGQVSQLEGAIKKAAPVVQQQLSNVPSQVVKAAGSMVDAGKAIANKPYIDSGYNPYGIKTVAQAIQAKADRDKARNSVGSTAASYAQMLSDRAKEFAGIKSRYDLDKIANPFTSDYANRAFTGAMGGIQRNFGDVGQQLRDHLAARGITQAGQSGVERGEFDNLAEKNQLALRDAALSADMQTRDKSADWEARRAAALDGFELAKQAGSVQAAEAALRGFTTTEMLPHQVLAAKLANEHSAAMNPIQLQAARAEAEQQIAMNPWLLKEAANRAGMSEQQLNMLKFQGDNQWALAILGAASGVAGGVTQGLMTGGLGFPAGK